MTMVRKRTGAAGETAACEYLLKRGYRLVATNVRNRFGEVDVVMRDGQTLVFVEVKTRRTRESGHPAEAVTPRKIAHIVAVALDYLRHVRHTGPWRIDVVAINGDEVSHLPDVTGLA